MDELVAVMLQAHGLDVSVFDAVFLARTAAQRGGGADATSVAAYCDRVARERAEADALVDALHVSYSDLFRDPLTFAVLETMVLPTLVDEKERAGGAEIRVWSAGCAAGQEAWSLAILLDELTTQRKKSVPFRIFATDRSSAVLARAEAGAFDFEALGRVRLRHLASCFERQGERYVVAERLQRCVAFSPYDLLDATTTSPPASIYGDFDLVLCCNVLLYYAARPRRRLLEKLRRALAPRGVLVTGDTERQAVAEVGGFTEVAPPSAVFRLRPRAEES